MALTYRAETCMRMRQSTQHQECPRDRETRVAMEICKAALDSGKWLFPEDASEKEYAFIQLQHLSCQKLYRNIPELQVHVVLSSWARVFLRFIEAGIEIRSFHLVLSSDDPVRRCRCAYFERHLSKEYRILIRPLPSVKLMRTLINPLPKSSFRTTVRWRPVQQGNGLVPALFAFPASLNLHTACRTDPWALSERARSALKKVASLPRRQHLPSNWNNASWLDVPGNRRIRKV